MMGQYYFASFKPLAPLMETLLSLLFLAGIVQAALWIQRWMGWRRDFLRLSALAFCVMAAVSGVVQGLVMTSWAYAPLLRILFYGLCVPGLVLAYRVIAQRRALWQWSRRKLEVDDWKRMERVGWWALAILVAVLGFLAMTPPSDADTISYHLAAPLDILRHHGLVPRPDWPVMRMMGAGEHLNLLGLSAGVETVGAALQWLALAILLINILVFPARRWKRLGVALAFASMPLMLFLVPTQKVQLLPAVAVCVAAMLLVRFQRRSMHSVEMLAFVCLCFAVICKHSFVLTAGILGMFWLYCSWRRGEALSSFLKMILVYGVVALPFHAWNLVIYGDPLPPMLEAFKSCPNPFMVNLAHFVRSYQDNHFWFPLGLVIPASGGAICTVMGIGVVVALFDPRRLSRTGRFLVLLAVVQVITMVLLGQKSARFFVEVYGVLLIALLASPRVRMQRWQMGVVWLQTFLTLAVALASLWLLGPGIFTREGRDKVMTRCSHGYAICKWLDHVLPPEAVIVASNNGNYFMPRPFVPYVLFQHANWNDPDQLQRLRVLARAGGVNTLVGPPAVTNKFKQLGFEVVREWAPSGVFPVAARNPFNQGKAENICAYHVRVLP